MSTRHAGLVPASAPLPVPTASGQAAWWTSGQARGDGWWRAIAALLLLLVFAIPANAQTFPKFTGLVVDAANVIPDDREAALRQKLEALQQRTQRQFVVATIPDLQGSPIEDYGYRLGREWGVGLKDADNGAILIVAPRERKVRIEVGRRLEPVLTDALSSIIIRNRILPAFKQGDMAGGIEAGAEAVIQQLGAPDAQAKAEADKATKEFDRTHKKSAGGDGVPFGLIFWGMVVLFVVLAMRRGRSGAKGPWGQKRYRSGGGDNGWIWLWAASEMLNQAGRDRPSSGGGLWGGGSGSGGGWGGSDGSWGGGGFTGGGGGDFGGGGASGDW